MLKNLIRKSLLLGMGAISLTKEKAENIVKELEEKGELKSHETKDFVNELVEKGEQERIVFRDTIKKEVTSLLANMGVPAKSDYDALEERVRRLEERQGIFNSEKLPDQTANYPSGE